MEEAVCCRRLNEECFFRQEHIKSLTLSPLFRSSPATSVRSRIVRTWRCPWVRLSKSSWSTVTLSAIWECSLTCACSVVEHHKWFQALSTSNQQHVQIFPITLYSNSHCNACCGGISCQTLSSPLISSFENCDMSVFDTKGIILF